MSSVCPPLLLTAPFARLERRHPRPSVSPSTKWPKSYQAARQQRELGGGPGFESSEGRHGPGAFTHTSAPQCSSLWSLCGSSTHQSNAQ